jgi:hypothetical protein
MLMGILPNLELVARCSRSLWTKSACWPRSVRPWMATTEESPRLSAIMRTVSDDVVLAFPEPIPPLRHVRSTLVLGGIASLEAAGLLDAYAEVSPPDVRAAVQSAVAGMWLPVETAVAHYLACDRLGLSSESAATLGRGTFGRTKGLLLGTAIGLARGAGVTPWTLIPHLQRFWLRGMDGGGVRALRLGPKEARLDVLACPLFESQYFRGAYRGLAQSLFELVCQKAYAHEQRLGDPRSSTSLRMQWV